MDDYFDLKQTTSINISPNLNTSHTRNKRRLMHKKVKVGNHQEMAQSERNFHSKTGVLLLVLFVFLRLFSIFAFVVLIAFETLV